MESWREMDEQATALFRTGFESRLVGNETFEYAMDLTFDVAALRSPFFSRTTSHLDMEVVAAVLCWWPLKPPPSPQYEERIRVLRPVVRELTENTRGIRNRTPLGFYGVGFPFPGVPIVPGGIPRDEYELLGLLLATPADVVVNYLLSLSA